MVAVYTLMNCFILSGNDAFVSPPSMGRREMVMAGPAAATIVGAASAHAAADAAPKAAAPAAKPAAKPDAPKAAEKPKEPAKPAGKVVKAKGFSFTVPSDLTETPVGYDNFYRYYKTDSAFIQVGPYSKDLVNKLVNQYATPTLTGGPALRVVKNEQGATQDDLELIRMPRSDKVRMFASISRDFPPSRDRGVLFGRRPQNSEHVYVRSLKGPNGGATMVIKLDEEVNNEVMPLLKYPETPKQTVKAKAVLDSLKLL